MMVYILYVDVEEYLFVFFRDCRALAFIMG
jgi:hypothetical protein